MAEDILAEALKNAWLSLKKIKNSPKSLAAACFCDILFFVMYGFIANPLFVKIIDYVIIIGSVISENAGSFIGSSNPSIASIIISNPEAGRVFASLAGVYIALALSLYLVYTFFQGVAWSMGLGIAGMKKGMYDFMVKFALINLFWLAVFSAYHFLSLFADIRAAALQNAGYSHMPSSGIIMGFILFAIAYFAFISYSLIGKSAGGSCIMQGFRIGIKKIGKIAPAALVIGAAALILNLILKAAASLSFTFMVIAGLIAVIPAMTWARVYLASTVKSLK